MSHESRVTSHEFLASQGWSEFRIDAEDTIFRYNPDEGMWDDVYDYLRAAISMDDENQNEWDSLVVSIKFGLVGAGNTFEALGTSAPVAVHDSRRITQDSATEGSN
jgi:hypothetical protein